MACGWCTSATCSNRSNEVRDSFNGTEGKGTMATSWPLVGRRHELDVVTAALEDGVVAGVVLSGAAGVGKTRLADECLARAGSLGFATARATATQATSDIPFGALAPLLPAA